MESRLFQTLQKIARHDTSDTLILKKIIPSRRYVEEEVQFGIGAIEI